MATKHHKAKSRPTRNPKAAAARSSRRALPADTPAIANLVALEDTIEEERARLMIAHSLLNCAAIAMEAEDVCTADSPHYPSIVEMARDLINRSINRLDSVARNRAMEDKRDADDEEFEDGLDPALHGSYRVKEPGAVYLCSTAFSWPDGPILCGPSGQSLRSSGYGNSQALAHCARLDCTCPLFHAHATDPVGARRYGPHIH